MKLNEQCRTKRATSKGVQSIQVVRGLTFRGDGGGETPLSDAARWGRGNIAHKKSEKTYSEKLLWICTALNHISALTVIAKRSGSRRVGRIGGAQLDGAAPGRASPPPDAHDSKLEVHLVAALCGIMSSLRGIGRAFKEATPVSRW